MPLAIQLRGCMNTVKRNKKAITVRLTPKAHDLIAGLSDKLGLSQTAVIEMAIRLLAEREHVADSDNNPNTG